MAMLPYDAETDVLAEHKQICNAENSYNTRPSRCPHISLSMMFLIISDGTSPSVRIAFLFGSGLIKYSVGSPRTCYGLDFKK